MQHHYQHKPGDELDDLLESSDSWLPALSQTPATFSFKY